MEIHFMVTFHYRAAIAQRAMISYSLTLGAERTSPSCGVSVTLVP